MKLSALLLRVSRVIAVAGLIGSVVGLPAHAQLSFTGEPRTQNFDGLSNTGINNAWVQSITLPGWYLRNTNGNANVASYFADDGSTATGRIYSYGTTNSNERALGSVSSSTSGGQYYFLRLINQTGQTVTNFKITYTGEQWRRASTNTQELAAAYRIFPSTPSLTTNSTYTGSYTQVANLNFTSPNIIGGASSLDGNAAANKRVKAATVTTNWLVNQELWIRWHDTDDASFDHGLAIDDVSFAVFPSITALSSTTITAGSVNQSLTIAGTNFFPNISTVLWNGMEIIPSFVTSTTITFSIPNSYITRPGYAKISVSNTSAAVSEAIPIAIVEIPANTIPVLTVGVTSTQIVGSTITMNFFIVNRSAEQATNVTITPFLTSLNGAVSSAANPTITFSSDTIAGNTSRTGTIIFNYSPDPTAGNYIFRLRGTFTYNGVAIPSGFGTAQRVRVLAP